MVVCSISPYIQLHLIFLKECGSAPQDATNFSDNVKPRQNIVETTALKYLKLTSYQFRR